MDRAGHGQGSLASSGCEVVEHTFEPGLPPLLVRDLRGVDACPQRRLRDKILVDVTEAEALGHETPDLVTTRAGRM